MVSPSIERMAESLFLIQDTVWFLTLKILTKVTSATDVCTHLVHSAGKVGDVPLSDADVARGVEGEVGASVQAGELRAGTAQHLQTHWNDTSWLWLLTCQSDGNFSRYFLNKLIISPSTVVQSLRGGILTWKWDTVGLMLVCFCLEEYYQKKQKKLAFLAGFSFLKGNRKSLNLKMNL